MSIKKFIKNFIIEQDENLVQVSPDEYLETLENVGGVADRISKLKPYRGKGIVITGPLNVSNYKNIGPLTGVVRVMGRLDISHSNVPNVNGITVDGYVSDYGSTMWRIKMQKDLDKKYQDLNVLRSNNEWNIATGGDDDAERTEALYDYLLNNDEVGTYEDENGEEQTEDKYFINPYGRGNYGYGKQYEWLGNDEGFNPKVYDVYREDELDDAAKQSISGLIDDVGYDAFTEWVWTDAIDREQFGRWLNDFYSDLVYGDPESYDIPLSLNSTQEQQVEKLEKSINELKLKLANDNLPSDQKDVITKKIEGFENIIEDIQNDPEGGYDDDAIEREVEGRVEEYIDNIKDFMDDFGYDKKFVLDFIDIDELTNTIVSSDGYGSILNSYDGDYDTQTINGTTYYIMRNN
jgi:hypothetical protein